MSMMQEFKGFLLSTNAFALAVGVILGGAVGKVVSSIVSDLLMPVIGLAVPGGAWRTWQIVLTSDTEGKPISALNVGSFFGTLVDFVIIGFVIFMLTRVLMKPQPGPAPVPTKTCTQCTESVPLAAKKCKFCASSV